jgi:hypothetical protein
VEYLLGVVGGWWFIMDGRAGSSEVSNLLNKIKLDC